MPLQRHLLAAGRRVYAGMRSNHDADGDNDAESEDMFRTRIVQKRTGQQIKISKQWQIHKTIFP